jgi:1-aminocyclopropane-1-carboxylate deaminase/D-cysteine desulfhydrase-like pyridoxal-dependent ACC family enzyme
MDQVSVLRLDQLGGRAPGNKVFKLRENLALARHRGVRRIVSFGGGWSNHLHALAAVGNELGLETIGLVRGEPGEADTPTLADARNWGMEIRRISRDEYRRRNDVDFLAEVEAQFQPCLVIAEGGANPAGIRGCMAIADLIEQQCPQAATVVLPVGTGATLAGLAAGLAAPRELLGISALKGAGDLEQRVEQGLREAGLAAAVPWRIRHEFHCGGFARSDESLREFILEFERVHHIPLDPVYTGKMMYAIYRLLQNGEWGRDTQLLAIHTGGLQGRRGYNWL